MLLNCCIEYDLGCIGNSNTSIKHSVQGGLHLNEKGKKILPNSFLNLLNTDILWDKEACNRTCHLWLYYLIGARYKLQLIHLLLVQDTRYKIQLSSHYKVQDCNQKQSETEH